MKTFLEEESTIACHAGRLSTPLQFGSIELIAVTVLAMDAGSRCLDSCQAKV